MDDKLFDAVYKDTPKFNPIIAGNICCDLMRDVEKVVIDTILASQRDYPEGLRFARLERVDPQTEFNNCGWNKESRDITKNTFYMVRLVFEYKNKPVDPVYLYLPYCYKGGIMVIGGSIFSLSPVLIDPCFSVTENSIFIHINKDKITFSSTPYRYLESGNRVNEKVVCCKVYKGGDKKKSGSSYGGHRTKSMQHVTALYMFVRHGFTETMRMYTIAKDVVIGFDEINEDFYPADEWTICTSAGIRPNTYSVKRYTSARVSVAIKTKQLDHVTRSYLASFFYIVDHFPEYYTEGDVDSPEFYKVLLARMILPYQKDPLIAFRDTHRHLESLDNHIDERTKLKLKSIENVTVDNIYDLFDIMIGSYEQRFTQTVDQLTTMYGKRLVLLEYLLRDIIKAINYMAYSFQSIKGEENITPMKISEKISHHLKPYLIQLIKYDHKELSSLQIACDNLIAKVSSPVMLQANMGKSDGDKKTPITLAMTLSASIAEVGSISSTAGDKTGRSRLNMFVETTEDGYIKRNPDLIDIIDQAQIDIRR